MQHLLFSQLRNSAKYVQINCRAILQNYAVGETKVVTFTERVSNKVDELGSHGIVVIGTKPELRISNYCLSADRNFQYFLSQKIFLDLSIPLDSKLNFVLEKN
ncbi:hypothetical protein BpHYR1_003771 [Brachionus plicatilis]|uniref:Uncharacterized protein n=1 Tax=Brachionus plicatilis TaxID=10195 RepID=A0A3M7QCQ3_BRAPC|nr:hypothetical protein BpHYR1_003771 [Brachionus plicatilis]